MDEGEGSGEEAIAEGGDDGPERDTEDDGGKMVEVGVVGVAKVGMLRGDIRAPDTDD